MTAGVEFRLAPALPFRYPSRVKSRWLLAMLAVLPLLPFVVPALAGPSVSSQAIPIIGQATAQSLPIAYWIFDEASGSTATDSSSNGNTATIVGAIRVPGKMGGALSFRGLSDFVYASDPQSGGITGAGLDMGTRDWTVAAWIKTSSAGMVITKMGFVGGANPDGWGMSVSANGNVGAVIHKSNGGIVNIFSGDGQRVHDEQWHHIAVVFNRACSMIRYVDGLQSGTRYSLAGLSGQSLDNTSQVRIGARDQAGDEIYFNGLIDDTRVYAVALTP